jgi:hypothetical protein
MALVNGASSPHVLGLGVGWFTRLHNHMKDEPMNPRHPLTQLANKRLVAFLEKVGNRLNTPHRMALCALNDSLTKMAEGQTTGRLAFGLPTGTGKTRAIIEWCASVHALKLPYSVAVSSSRIDALITMKADMLAVGIPDSMIGVLHESPSKGASNTDAENQDRQILLMSHQMIRASEKNLQRYNLYQGKPRNLLLYDESLLTSEVNHFAVRSLVADLSHAIETIKFQDRHADIHNWLTTIKATLEAEEAGFFEGMSLKMIDQPHLDPNLAAYYMREWRTKHGLVPEFLKAANVPLRILRSGTAAVVSYQIVMPGDLKNVLILDASFPVRKLCHYDSTIKNAETFLNLKRQGVDFATIKKFDAVELFRLKSYGGRSSMEKRFKDRQMAKEVVAVVKTLPETDAILCYVYKQQQLGGCDYSKILKSELERAGVDLTRIHIDTFGNETSLNSYGHCQHVFLVGILHRDVTQLVGQYLGQIRDIKGEVSKELADDIHLSERAHLAYQALSRGSCRFVDSGQASPMKGYIVEIDPEIETTLSKVMPGVKWSTWKPVFLADTESLMAKVVVEIKTYLSTSRDFKISSRKLKAATAQENVSPMTWNRAVKEFCEQSHASKENHVRGGIVWWKLQGQSLVKQTPESLGFSVETGA